MSTATGENCLSDDAERSTGRLTSGEYRRSPPHAHGGSGPDRSSRCEAHVQVEGATGDRVEGEGVRDA